MVVIGDWRKRRAFVWQRDGGVCGLCGLVVADGEPWEIDHLIPRSEQGSDDVGNLRVSHKRCNRTAGAVLGSKHKRAGQIGPAVINGRVSVEFRLPEWKWQHLTGVAKRERRSTHSTILVLIEEALAAREPRA